MMNDPYTNPESAFHRRILEKERASQRRSGRIALWVSGSLLVAFTLLNSVLALRTSLSFWSFLLIEFVIAGGFGAMLYVFGWTEYKAGTRPVTDQEVDARRQSERARLLREARGILPVSLRPRVLILEFILGVLFIAAGVVLLVLSYATPLDQFWGRLYGIGFLLCGFSFLSLVLIVKRRRAKQLPAESARELSYRLTRGEITEGSEGTGDDQSTEE
jgi:hypothetical protein